MPKFRFPNKPGHGFSEYHVEAVDPDEVWFVHPVRTRYGTSYYRQRFTAAESLEIAEALVDAAAHSRSFPCGR